MKTNKEKYGKDSGLTRLMDTAKLFFEFMVDDIKSFWKQEENPTATQHAYAETTV